VGRTGILVRPLWTNLNLFTATTIVLTGVSYPNLLALTLPFALLGLAATAAAFLYLGALTLLLL
jgi:hypothetical protein